MKRLKIVAFGDSLTAGVAVPKDENNWTDILANELDAEVINSGIGGNTSAQGLARIQKDVISHMPDAVLICFGMNDHVITSEDGRCKVSEADFCRNITEIVTRVRDIGAKPILITPNAVIEEYYFRRHPREWYESVGGANAQLAKYCERIREIAATMSLPVVDIFNSSSKQELRELLRTPEHGKMADGVHPYGNGISFYANAIITILKEALSFANGQAKNS